MIGPGPIMKIKLGGKLKKKKVPKKAPIKAEEIVKVPVNLNDPPDGLLGEPYFKMLKLSEIKIFRFNPKTGKGYQRQPKPAWIDEIYNNYSTHLSRPLHVVERPDGSFWLTDGQQHMLAAIKSGIKVHMCSISRTNGDVAVEAWLYGKLNGKIVDNTPYEAFWPDLAVGYPDAVLVDEVVYELGYALAEKSKHPQPFTVTCIKKMREWAGKDSVAFRAGMYASAQLYDGGCIHNSILNGLCRLETHFIQRDLGETVKRPDFIKKLKRAGLEEIFKAISALAGSTNNQSRGQANGILNVWNSRRHDPNRIPHIA